MGRKSHFFCAIAWRIVAMCCGWDCCGEGAGCVVGRFFYEVLAGNKIKKDLSDCLGLLLTSRDEKIRTSDHTPPRRVL